MNNIVKKINIQKNKKRFGIVSISAIMVLTLFVISCSALQIRLNDYITSEKIDIDSENLLRKAEGATIITKEKVVEATQNLYDESTSRNDLKNKIESFSYRKKYVSEIEDLKDVNIDNVKIDVYRNDIAEDGSGLYKFWIYITAMNPEKNMKRKMSLCVTLKNIYKDKEEEKEENKDNLEQNKNDTDKNPDIDENEDKIENNQEIEEVPIRYNARDALIFRIEKEY